MGEVARIVATFAVACTPLLTACGLYLPKPHEFYEPGKSDAIFLNAIETNVKCELQRGAFKSISYLGSSPEAIWLSEWGAKVDLKFTIDETGGLNPGVVWSPPPPFLFAFNVGSSAHATRVEEVAFTYAFKDLLEGINATNLPKSCEHENGILIQSDLDIADFIFKNIFTTTIPDTVPSAVSKTFFDTLQYTVTFVASYNANLTPSWTFTRVKVDSSGNLLSASRSKTSNLLITFSRTIPAPPGVSPGTPVQLSPEGQAVHNAGLIGQAVGAANQSFQR